jgi:hypothetical protein
VTDVILWDKRELVEKVHKRGSSAQRESMMRVARKSEVLCLSDFSVWNDMDSLIQKVI